MEIEIILRLIEALKWPITMILTMISLFLLINNLNNTLNKFVEAYKDKDTIQITRNHSFAIAEGVQDSFDNSGSFGPFSYLFWFPKRRVVEGQIHIVNPHTT